MMDRRSLITGVVSLVAAPAIVRADSLMKLPKPAASLIEAELGLTIQPGLQLGDLLLQGDRVMGVITAIGKGGEFMFRGEGMFGGEFKIRHDLMVQTSI
jgi:hypothetical protein